MLPLHFVLFGIMLGLGASIPIGPINLEMIRRNLHYGSMIGIALGLGACFADVTYLVLIFIGAFHILVNSTVLKVVGVVGGFILFWFGFKALEVKKISTRRSIKDLKSPSFLKHFSEGYALTLLNPLTIIFWSSVSVTLVNMADNSKEHLIAAMIGVLLGTVFWVLSLNFVLHHTKHRLSERTMVNLNRLGGIIIILFAIFSIWHAFFST